MTTQIAAWLGEDSEGTYLIRMYEGGRMTAERKMFATGLYTGEVELTPEAFDFLGASARVKAVS